MRQRDDVIMYAVFAAIIFAAVAVGVALGGGAPCAAPQHHATRPIYDAAAGGKEFDIIANGSKVCTVTNLTRHRMELVCVHDIEVVVHRHDM